jgi:hypothetical protein
LLIRISFEEFFIQFAADLANYNIFRCGDPAQLLRFGLKKSLELIAIELEAIQFVNCIKVDGDRNQLPVHTCQYPMFIWSPRSEMPQVIEYLSCIGVENMRPVFVN